MKLYLTIVLFIALSVNSNAQTGATTFDVEGLKVIFRPTQKETVSIAMYYRGGVMNYPVEEAGIEHLALSSATSCGTKNYKVEDYKELADEYGINISGGSSTDYGIIAMSCINKYLPQGWKLFSDAIANPVFDQSEFQVEKDKLISAVRYRESQPEAVVDQMTLKNMFQSMPYSISPLGNEASLRKITSENVRNYYHNKLLNKKSMFLVVAGKITKEELEQMIRTAFSSVPIKPYTAPVYTDVPLVGDKLVTAQRNIATNYISRVMNAPAMSNPDYPAFRLAITVLSSYLHYKLRTEQALSYAPGAKVELLQIPYTSLYISTTQPKLAIKGMMEAFDAIKQGKYNPGVLRDIKKSYRLDDYRDQESSATLVSNLGKAEILGSYKLEENLLTAIDNVDQNDVSRVFNKYLKGSIWIFVGDEQLGKEAF